MEHKKAIHVPIQTVDDPAASDVQVRWLVGPESGAPNFHMRQFHVAPGGHTPRHSHPWEHECYILSGNGTAFGGAEGERPIHPGDVLLIHGGEEHQFINNSDDELVFLCMVPIKRDA